MSNFFLADRIKETSRVEGQVPVSLDGPVAGFSSFDDFYASGDVVFYAITDNSKYEVGSGVYAMIGSTRSITRFPIRSSDMNSGPYVVDGTSEFGNGLHYPLWLTKSAAQSGVGFADGPYTAISGVTFDEYAGQTFYYATEHAALAVGSAAGSGDSWANASDPVNFTAGLKEVFVTYPGKTAVLNGYGLGADINEPQESGVAVWKNGQLLNYSSELIWDEANKRLGISQANPQYSIDIGGVPAHSFVNASGYIEGGSGVLFSGGALTYTGKTASGGKQLEPFLRNQLGDGADGLIQLSGLVDQFIGLLPQSPGLVFAGPDPNYCGTGNCPPQVPTFRLLSLEDIPVAELTTSGNFIVQKNTGLDGESANITPNNFTLGMVAIYAGSGSVTYDSGILFDYTNDRLLVGGDASTDTPAYTVDARGTIGSQSGYFNQVLFQDGLIRIGNNAGTNDGNLTENFYGVNVGNNAGFNGSGNFDLVGIGRFAAINATECSGLAALGRSVGDAASNVREVTAGGTEAVKNGSNIASGVIFGPTAAQGLRDSEYVVLFGTQAGQSGSGLVNVVAIGYNSAASAKDLNNVVAIGENAARAASGINNTYIGSEAGHGASGNNNIEVTNGTTLLAGNTSNKINLGGVIQGDVSSSKLAVGSPSGIDPLATLVLEPANADDAAFLVRVPGSGSASNPVEVQSGDGTTFYAITNSGDVDMAGWLQPSGGLWLSPNNPTRNSGVGGYMLWNNGNTLTWNGSPVGGAGSFTSWTALAQNDSQAVSDGQAVTFSGVSGVDVTLLSNRRVIFDGAELSGICVALSGQIAASDYSFVTFASGVGSNNNDPKTMTKNSVLAVSGVSGIKVDFTDQNNSGIFTIGYDISNTYTFDITNGAAAADTITNTETVTLSGVSGVSVEYADVAGGAFFRFAAPELSGVFRNDIDAATSGTTMVSGIAVWSSGEFSRRGLGSTAGTSGVKLQDGRYIMDPLGSGNINMINFPNGRIHIGAYSINAIDDLQDVPGAIVIGSGAGEGAITFGDDHVIAIGTDAMGGNSSGSRLGTIAIGRQAIGSESSGDTQYCIAMGYNAGRSAAGNQNISIGFSAGLQNSVFSGGRNSGFNIAIGVEAGMDQDEDVQGHNLNIGSYAGRHCEAGGYNVSVGYQALAGQSSFNPSINVTNSVAVGRNAGYLARDGEFNLNLGYAAGYNASGVDRAVFAGESAGAGAGPSVLGNSVGKMVGVGSFALNSAEDAENTIGVGNNAGSATSGVSDSVLLGSYAGYKRSGANSFVVSVNDAIPTYDATWCSHDTARIIDICESIQGTARVGGTGNVNLHLGMSLDNASRDISIIEDATVNVTPTATSDSAMLLYLNGTTPGSQAAGLMKSQMRSGTTVQSVLNEIINEKGVLRVPRATSKTGTGNSAVLIADNGNTIDAGPGVICTYNIAGGVGQGIAVSLYDSGAGNYVWYKIPTTTKF